jgi:hypothetical protein
MKAGLKVFNQHLLVRSPLDPRFLLIQARGESLGCFVLLNDGRLEIFSLLRNDRFLFLDFAMFF